MAARALSSKGLRRFATRADLDPGLEIKSIESSCCEMAGSFGYEAEHYAASKAMAALSLLPALREAALGDLVVADGTSCRHQIRDGVEADPLHVARVVAMDDALG